MASHRLLSFNKDQLKTYWQNLSTSQFTGYVMMSGEPLKHAFASPTALPSWEAIHSQYNFIWEANLYEKDKRSISIRQANEQWQVVEVSWDCPSENAKGDFIEHKYVLRVPEGGKFTEKTIVMKEAWFPSQDELCEGMEVLKPAWSAFIGFTRKEE